MKDVVDKLIELNKTISTMESCTGGGLANSITNVSGSSSVFKFGAVTYSNSFKIKMGVDESIIDKYSVYSSEVAREMSKKISMFTESDYGVGITGKLNDVDKNNLYGADNQVFISIYDASFDKFYDANIFVDKDNRCDNKSEVINKVKEILLTIIK